MSDTRQNTDYGYDIQKVYLEMMLTDAETFVRCQTVFDPQSFDRRLQSPAKFLSDYVIEHKPKTIIEFGSGWGSTTISWV